MGEIARGAFLSIGVASRLLGLAAVAFAAMDSTVTALVKDGLEQPPAAPPWLVVLFAAAGGSAIARSDETAATE